MDLGDVPFNNWCIAEKVTCEHFDELHSFKYDSAITRNVKGYDSASL